MDITKIGSQDQSSSVENVNKTGAWNCASITDAEYYYRTVITVPTACYTKLTFAIYKKNSDMDSVKLQEKLQQCLLKFLFLNLKN